MADENEVEAADVPVTEPVLSGAGERTEPPAGTPLSPEETATMQAAFGAASTGAGPSDRAAATSSITDAEMKGWLRANMRWVMAELDYARSGRLADERETLNP